MDEKLLQSKAWHDGYRAAKYETQEQLETVTEQNAKLREALDKAEKVVSAARNLVRVKGRHHSEQATNQLIAALTPQPENREGKE